MGKWARIRSWHYIKTFTRVHGGFIARCGRSGNWLGEMPDDPPLNEKSCETCLRLKEHDEGTDSR